MSFQNQLKRLYREIHTCHLCRGMDLDKGLRRIVAVDPSMDVFIISQALAETQLRESGVNFFTLTGDPGRTGEKLEKFLKQFNRTIYPPNKIRLKPGIFVAQATPPFSSVYNSEITQCFPGKTAKKRDRTPNETEIATCLRQRFLEREIALIKPKLIFLMGDVSRKAFFRYFLKTPRKDTLLDHLNSICVKGSIPRYKIGEIRVSVLPIPHPAARNNYFPRLLENEPLIMLIRKLLGQS